MQNSCLIFRGPTFNYVSPPRWSSVWRGIFRFKHSIVNYHTRSAPLTNTETKRNSLGHPPYLAAFNTSSAFNATYQCWGLPPKTVPINSWKILTEKKATLLFSAISSKRGNLNLDLNLDLQRVKFQGVLMFYTPSSGSWILYNMYADVISKCTSSQ